ncbi:transcriptional regulator, MarR family protein [Ketogulonicigenium robustum]|uniref:Transcriptional regulator, MarR family protein n=1 Tax=Ketogulonicigenium robustum TaxID=92947 RepID=A0A1W6NYP1_9RHOB|nr:MarR family transcriptional regulator [Ketogulonicigenium robustum]ARO14309.1 transcriptional regulator, MarR family protein [Ketogulonicigenium robustum]
MNHQRANDMTPAVPAQMVSYFDALGLVERLHRLLLDLVKDEFERLGLLEINPVQALLLFNIAEQELTAGELKSRGFYQGSNVSYNLKKLVDLNYLHHERSTVDRRAVRIRLSEKGRRVRETLQRLFAGHADGLVARGVLPREGMDDLTLMLRRVERYWSEQIRYIY